MGGREELTQEEYYIPLKTLYVISNFGVGEYYETEKDRDDNFSVIENKTGKYHKKLTIKYYTAFAGKQNVVSRTDETGATVYLAYVDPEHILQYDPRKTTKNCGFCWVSLQGKIKSELEAFESYGVTLESNPYKSEEPLFTRHS